MKRQSQIEHARNYIATRGGVWNEERIAEYIEYMTAEAPQVLKVNPILRTDSYKLSQWNQIPPDTKFMYSHLMSRGGFWKHTMFSGLQYILKTYFCGKVFNMDDVEDARKKAYLHFNNDNVFNHKGWTRLYEKHGGMLPLRFQAPPEGKVIPIKNCLMTIQNTDDEFAWLTDWAETIALHVWYPITVGTLSFEIRQAIGKDLVKTGTPSLIDYKCHDFGYRGVSSVETAAIGGAAHLMNFLGTDTLAAIELLDQYYGCPMAGYSIPAMEHSTVTSWRQGDDSHEEDSYCNMLDKYPDGLAACVVDSYDTHYAVDTIMGKHMRERILRRNGTVVQRPDSGEPVIVLEDIFNADAENFGFDTNVKGYRVLPPQIRVIQGDGVNYQNILRINSELTRKGWSMDNWGYGMGGALLQQQNRDTMRFAIKCSAINRSGVWSNVWKKPKTDSTKDSRGGRFNLFEEPAWVTTESNGDEMEFGNILHTVSLDGVLKKEYTRDEVWEMARGYDRYEQEASE